MKTIKFLSLILFAVFLGVSCQYIFIIPEDDGLPIIDPDDPDAPVISLSENVLPIFVKSCVACHKSGGTSPNLTEGNVFNSLNSPKFINLDTPEESKIYLHPHPDTDTHKHKKYSNSQAAVVLAWIQGGAEDN